MTDHGVIPKECTNDGFLQDKDMIATTIEQSKRLLDAGVNPKTADMCFQNYVFRTNDDGDIILDSIKPTGGLTVGNPFTDYPAWSLSALWDIIPPAFRDVVFNSMRTIDKDSENLIEIAVQFIEETWIKK